MLVHPDKNQGNEKAAEAFKKLQNAHENGGHGFFPSGFARSKGDGEDFFGEPRRIACKRCNNFHFWLQTKKPKSQARWCQECNDYHQAKDGDGWLEQAFQLFLFGLLQKVNPPTPMSVLIVKFMTPLNGYICQGMRCPANTHKPSFHVNNSMISKHSAGKGTGSGQEGACGPPMEEIMTEEEFCEWLQNAMHAGFFENFVGTASADSPMGRGGNGCKSDSTGSSSGGCSKRKKKGRKQW